MALLEDQPMTRTLSLTWLSRNETALSILDAFWRAEIEGLREAGAPDTDMIVWAGKPRELDEERVLVTAEVTEALAGWMAENDLVRVSA
jgi:hypothetical protein